MSTDDNRTAQDAQSELADRLQDTAWMAQRLEVLESQVEGRSREIERLAALASSWQATAQRLAEAGDAADRHVVELEALLLRAKESVWFQIHYHRWMADESDQEVALRGLADLIDVALKNTQDVRDNNTQAEPSKILAEDRTFNPIAFEELIAGIESDRDNAIDASDGDQTYYMRTATRQIEAVHAVMDLATHYGLLNEDTASGAE